MPLSPSGGQWSDGYETTDIFGTVLTNGNFLSLKVQTSAAGVSDLVGQVYTPGGGAVGSGFVLKSVTPVSFEEFAVTPLENGRFAAAWVYHIIGGDKLETAIFNADGSVFKAPVQLEFGNPTSPRLTTLADGSYAVNYHDIIDNSQSGLKSVILDANGVLGEKTSIQGLPLDNTAGLRGGGYATVVAKEIISTSGSGARADIKSYIRSPDGRLTETLVKSFPFTAAIDQPTVIQTEVIGLANGNFVVAWSVAGSEIINAQIVSSSGVLIGGELTLYQKAGADLFSMQLEPLLDGGFALAFVEEVSQGIYLGTYSEAGTAVAAPLLVSQPTYRVRSPSLDVLKDGRILVGWKSLEENATHYTTHFQAFSTGYTVPAGTDPFTSFGFMKNGTKGKDQFVGGWGDDKFYGGYGNDKLTGGAGADVFVFNAKLGTAKTDRKVNFDTITDFKPGEDKIWLDNAIFKKLGKAGTETTPAALNKKFFKLGKQAGDKNDYVVYDKKTGILSYDADGSGAKEAIEIAKLAKNLKLSHLDFGIV
ncbi:hypothetical protein AB4097_15220 [Microvirga sp. 2MCAF35]|uniref:M10 family metallopeptidase C-terminal domain-containing protein n=1 Tax=Microvirga sp. 2MCAF35 TaxID=3232987 RepID=UPI003F9DE260